MTFTSGRHPTATRSRCCSEEAGLPYRIVPINIGRGEQFAPETLRIAPDNRIRPWSTRRRPTAASRFRSSSRARSCSIWPTVRALHPQDLRGPRRRAAMAVLADGRSRADGRADRQFSQYAPEGPAPSTAACDHSCAVVDRRPWIGRCRAWRLLDRRHGVLWWIIRANGRQSWTSASRRPGSSASRGTTSDRSRLRACRGVRECSGDG